MDKGPSIVAWILALVQIHGSNAVSETYYMENECGRLIDMETEHLESVRIELTKYLVYPNNMDCVFRIKAPEDKRFEVKILKNNIEMSANCTNDFLQIYDGPELTNEVLQGLDRQVCSMRHLLASYVSTGRYVTVRFKSDEEGASAGFRLLLSAFRTDPDERCRSTEFQCKSNKRCISQQLVCDRYKDCTDASDECELSTPAIIGIAVGGTVGLLLIIGIFVCICWARSRSKRTGSTKRLNQQDNSDSAISPVDTTEVSDIHYNRPSSIYQPVYAVPSSNSAYIIDGPYYVYNKPEKFNARHVWITTPPEVTYDSLYNLN